MTLTSDSGVKSSAYVALPEAEQAPTLLLFHEWWGLNDQIKSVAREFANEGFIAVAIDLYQGRVATSRDEARAYKDGVDSQWANAAVSGWIEWLKQHSRSNGKVATLGWCYGGGWSLDASLLAPIDATVIYYGSVARKADELKPLKGPILGHFGTLDKFINEKMVGAFERELDKNGHPYHNYWYTADHAFANPTGARYDADDAALSWSRTLAFLHKHLD